MKEAASNRIEWIRMKSKQILLDNDIGRIDTLSCHTLHTIRCAVHCILYVVLYNEISQADSIAWIQDPNHLLHILTTHCH